MAIVLLIVLVVLVVLVVALLAMAVGGTLASVGVCLLLRSAACEERTPDPFGVVLLVVGAAAFLTPVLMAVCVYLAG